MSTTVTVIGSGNVGSAVAALAAKGGAQVQVLGRDQEKAAALAAEVSGTAGAVGEAITGDIVVLAVPVPGAPESPVAHSVPGAPEALSAPPFPAAGLMTGTGPAAGRRPAPAPARGPRRRRPRRSRSAATARGGRSRDGQAPDARAP